MTGDIQEPPPHLISRLQERYGEPHRAYHTWAHVEALLKCFHSNKNMLNAPVTVLWALYWHDAIYDPASGENELESAKLLRNDAEGLLSEEATADAAAIIEATAKHLVPNAMPAGKQSDLEFFLDIDLSILGRDEKTFDAYEAAIRKEYAFVPEAMYKAGRAAVLKGFLDRECLYFTDIFRDRWEAQARANLQRSIAHLELAS